MDNLLISLAGSGPIGAVLAIAIWQWIRLGNKTMSIIEGNTKAMTKLSDSIEAMLHRDCRQYNAGAD